MQFYKCPLHGEPCPYRSCKMCRKLTKLNVQLIVNDVTAPRIPEQ